MKKNKEKVSLHGLMVAAIEVNGKMVSRKVVVFFETKRVCKKGVYGQLVEKSNG